MALEKADLSTINKYVRDSVQRLPPRAMKAVGIGRVLGTPEAATPPVSDSSDRIATTAFVKGQGYVPAPSGLQTSDVPVWNGSTWVRPSGTPSASAFLRGDGSWAEAPGLEIGYSQITATVNITGTASTAATTIITSSALAFDGQPVIVEFFSPVVTTPSVAAGNVTNIGLYESGTLLAQIAQINTTAASTAGHVVRTAFRFTPAAGNHTYTIMAWATSTTGAPRVFAGSGSAGAMVPAFIRFTKV